MACGECDQSRLKEDAHEDDIGLLLVADAEIYRLDALVRWLDAADARIKRMPADRRHAPAPATSHAWTMQRRRTAVRR